MPSRTEVLLLDAAGRLRSQGLDVGPAEQTPAAWVLPWRCRAGHAGRTSVYKALDGAGCKSCKKSSRAGGRPAKVLANLAEGEAVLARSNRVLTATSLDGRELSWQCGAGHFGTSTVYNLLRGGGCLRCTRSGRQPRKPNVLEVGARNGDLEVVEYLGVVDGLSKVRVRNVISSVEAVMLTGDFRRAKTKLLGAGQLAELRRASAKKMLAKTAALAQHPNAKYTWADLVAVMAASGLELLTAVDGTAWLDYAVEVRVRCRCGLEFSPSVNNLRSGVTGSCGCVKSHQQADLAAFVSGLGFEVRSNDRELLRPREIDVVVPDLKLAIEYHGLYWHGEARRRENRTNTAEKATALRALGWRLVVVFEDEWVHRRAAVETRLRAILGRLEHRVGARKCSLVDLPTIEARQFMDATHLQGYGSGRTVALRHDGAVVAAATFAESNASRGRRADGLLELVRFAVKAGWSVPGAFQRLLGAGRADRGVVTYADTRWSDGAVYSRAGFRLDGVSPPSYWYFTNRVNRRLHRYTLRKSVLLERFGGDPVKTEWQLAQEAGYDRIWDLGCTRWVLEPSK
jgi:G:T-mismatch repair DNA endonuclease (very short patch repair protein)